MSSLAEALADRYRLERELGPGSMAIPRMNSLLGNAWLCVQPRPPGEA